MAAVSCALALLSGIIGAGFASGREIVCFFAGHGRACSAAIVCALFTLYILLLRLSTQLRRTNCPSLAALCLARFSPRLGRLCAALFFLLHAVMGGTMLAACAELSALILHTRHAYGFGLTASLALSAALSLCGASGPALPGAALCVLLPALFLRLLSLPAGEACFLPAMAPDLPVRAAADGAAYGALNAAMLSGMLPLFLSLSQEKRRNAVLLFAALFGTLLATGAAVCRRHLPAVWNQPLPFVYLSRQLGAGGYLLVAACMYAAALSTLLAMITGMSLMLPFPHRTLLSAGICLLIALFGFSPLVESGYPVLGALCAGLLILLCLPFDSKTAPTVR